MDLLLKSFDRSSMSLRSWWNVPFLRWIQQALPLIYAA